MLTDCLNAVYGQTRVPDRIIVVDNSGCLGATMLPVGAPAIELLCPGYNTGFAKGNNLAFAEVEDCQWVALLNPDTLPNQDWLEHLLDAADQFAGYAAFGSRMYSDLERTILDGTGDVIHVSGLVWRRDHGREAAGVRLVGGDVFAPCGAAALYRRDVVVGLGGFDDGFFCYVEDIDLGFRIRLAGYSCRYVPRAEVVHYGSAVTGYRSNFSLYYGHRNLGWLFVKNMPLSLLVMLFPLHLSMHFIAIVRFSFCGRGGVLLRAKWDAIKGLPDNWTKRKAVQLKRRVSTLQVIRTLSLW